MKTAGSIFLTLTFALLGSYMSQILVQRVKELEKLSSMLEEIKTSLKFSCPRVDALIEEISLKSTYRSLSFLRICREKLLLQEDFPKAWSSSLLHPNNKMHINKDDIEHLIDFGQALGTTDIECQMLTCDMYKSLIDESLARAKIKEEKYAKLFTPIFALLGFSAAVMLI